MSRRTRITAIFLVLLLALVVVAPALPIVREAIVKRVLDTLSGSGVNVTYSTTSGNAWRSITLHGVAVEGQGADVQLDRLTIGYFLPSLLGGELPIDVLVHGATGDVDVKQLLDLGVGEPGGGAAGPISLRLRKIDLRDIGVELAQVPFTLPDANIGNLSVTQDGTALELTALVTTPDGAATIAGRYDALTAAFTGRVVQADATIGRHWWDGVTAGTVTGTITVRGNAIDGDFVLSGGAVDDLGLTADDVSGDVTLRYPVITAELEGDTFGGRVAATGVVNIAAKRWEASGGGTAELEQAATWLVRSLLPEGLPVPLTGTVDVDLNVVGWEDMSLRGSATGSGAMADMPVEGLNATFAVTEDGNLTVNGGATVGGGAVVLTVGRDARGERVIATASDVALAVSGNELGTLSASLDMAAGGPQDGALLASWSADLGGRAVTAQLDATVDSDGWQAFVTGQDDLGTSVEGAVVLSDGRVDGGLTASEVAGLPLSEGARLVVATSGPLSAPTITVSVAGDEPVTLAVGPPELALIDDLRGSMTGTLDGTSVPDLSGAFGPVGVAGAVALSPMTAELNLTLAETNFAYADSASAPVAINASVLRLQDGGITWEGTLVTPGVSVGPLALTPGTMTASAVFGGSTPAGSAEQPWTIDLASSDGSLAVSASPSGFALDLVELPVTSSSTDLPVDARLSGTLRPSSPSPGAATGSDSVLVDMTVAAGSTFGPVQLAEVLALEGAVYVAGSTANLAGTSGALGVELDADWGSSSAPAGASLDATLTSGAPRPLNLTFDSASGRLAVTGAADPLVLLAAIGLLDADAGAEDDPEADLASLAALATADLTGRWTGVGLADLAGGIELDLTEPIALSSSLVGNGSSLEVSVEGGTGELPLSASGTLDLSDLAALTSDESPGLDVTLGPLTDIVVTTAGARGSGTYRVGSLGPVSVAPIPWSLSARWTGVDAPYATLTSDASALTIELEDGALWLSGAAAVPLAYAGEDLVMHLAVGSGDGRVQVGDLAAIPVRGSLEQQNGGAALLTMGGTLGELLVAGEVPTALLAAPLPAQAQVDGGLSIDAVLDLMAGPDFAATVVLSAAGVTLTGDVSGSGSDLRAELTGDDLHFTYDGSTLLVAADNASLAPFLGATDTAAGLSGTVDGTLGYQQSTGWTGALVTDLAWQAGEAPADPAQPAAAVTAAVTLRGTGDALELLVTATGPADSHLSASGSLAPSLDITAIATALNGAVAAEVDYQPAVGLTGTLTTASFAVEGYAQVPAQHAVLTWLPGQPVQVTGPGIDFTVDVAAPDAPLSGTLDLPFTLLDAPARLDAVLGGSLEAPSASLEVVGAGLAAIGTGTLSAAEATLTITEPAITRLLPDVAAQFAGLGVSPVTADAHWTADSGWTLVANSQVGSPPPAGVAGADSPPAAPGPRLGLELALAGTGATYSGGLDLRLDGERVANVAVAGVGADLAADLDLAAVQWDSIAERFGVEADVVGGGHARFTTAPLDASLQVDMSGTAGGLALTLSGTAPNDLGFTVTGETQAAGNVDLTGRLAWDQEQKAVVTGRLGDHQVDASLTLDDALTAGRLLVDVPGARLTADLTTPASNDPAAGAATTGPRRDVQVSAVLDGTAFGGLAGDLRAAITNEDGVTTLEQLSVDTRALPGLDEALPLSLSASGVLAPTTGVTGTLTAPTLGEEAQLEVSTQSADASSGTSVSLTWRDLLAVFDTASGQLRLSGEAALGDVVAGFLPAALDGLTADVAADDLTWSRERGFGGSLVATVDAPALADTGIGRPLVLNAAAATGAGAEVPTDLAVRFDVTTSAMGPVATVTVSVPADPFGATALDGSIEIDADLGAVVALPDVELLVAGSASIGGSLTEPTLAGTVRLTGDVTADGEFGYAAGKGSLALVGQDLSVTAALDGSTWTADAKVERLPLAAWLPQVKDPHLSLTATAASGGATRMTVEGLVIESDNSRLTGAATIDTGLRVILQAQVDLRDMNLAGTELHGLLRGPVIVTSPTIDSLTTANVTAQLDAAGVGVEAVAASVSGSLQVGGKVADPVITAVLRGNGELSGGLRLDTAPMRGRLQVHSDLAFGGFATNLDLNIDNDTTQARGQLRFGEAVLILSDDAGRAALTGAGLLDGWTVVLAPSLTGASVTGPLDRLVPGSSGTVDVAIGSGVQQLAELPTEQAWLRGTIADLVVAGQALGDLRLASSEPGAPVTVTGATVQANFAPASSDWDLALTGLALPGDLRVDVAGQGTGATGTVSGSVLGTGAVLVDVEVSLSVADAVSLSVAGSALGGTLDVEGHRASLTSGTWSGAAALSDAEYGGLDLQVVGTLYGSDLIPQALLTSSVSAESTEEDSRLALDLSGLISAGPEGITVDQQVEAAALTGPLRVRGRLTAPTDLIVSDAAGGAWQLRGSGAGLRATGSIAIDLGPATVTLGADSPSAAPTVALNLAGTAALALRSTLVGTDLVELLANVARDGLVFTGAGSARGSVVVTLSPTPQALLQDFGVELAGFDVEAEGTITAGATALTGTLVLPADIPTATAEGQLSLPWRLAGTGNDWLLDSDGNLGTLTAAVDLETLAGHIEVDLALPSAAPRANAVVERGITSGSVVGDLSYDPTTGARGSFAISDVILAPAAVGRLTVNADVAVAGGLVSGTAGIDTSGGRVTLSGSAAIAELIPGLELAGSEGARGSNLELRVRTLDLDLIPGIATTLPHLNGALSGVVQLRNGVILGQLVAPELAVGERLMPASLQLSGVPSSIDAALVVAGTLISADLEAGQLTGSARLERFPLELIAEAFVGPSDVTASLTGVLRFDVPLADPAAGFMRVATEEVRLARADVVTLGNVTITYDDRALNVERAEFGGRGSWHAGGVLSPELLDFRLEAEEADFSPLLGLVPDLARYAVGAAGSFTFMASGSFAAPQMSLESEALDIGFAGTRFRIEGTSASLTGVDLKAATTVRGLDPVQGAIQISGDATVMLEPLALRFVDFGFSGSLDVPGFGAFDDITGSITQDGLNNPQIDLTGMLGAPLSVSGTLVPLDVRAVGTQLKLSLPALLIGSATLSPDLRLRSEEGGLSLGGAVVADEIILDLGARAAEQAASTTDEGAASSEVAASALASSEAVAATEAAGARNAMEALRFDGLRVTAPQRVLLAMNIANIEAAVDLTVSGTAADPRLDGTAEALRGSLRFSGREFTFDSGVATFTANRGLLPELAITATTEFEKSRVLTGAPGVRFVSPSEGQTFSVGLSINGPVEAAPAAEGGFRFDVRPVLTSDALIEIEGEGVGTGVRSLTEPELLSLITLGRVDFESGLIGAGGLGGAVAQGALDTAVDLLIVGELQNALREALGLDVVEIRTSAISSLLDGDADQFGVSVRLGGYLNPELFASYRIGTADPGDPGFAFSNEVALSYALGPLDLDLVGRIDFPTAGTLASPRPELGVGLRYDFGRALGLDAGVTLSTQRSVVSFGVALRW